MFPYPDAHVTPAGLRPRRRRLPTPHPRRDARAGSRGIEPAGRLPPLRRSRSATTASGSSRSRPARSGGRGRRVRRRPSRCARPRGHAADPTVHRRREVDRPEAELHAPVRRRVPRDHPRGRGTGPSASTTSRSPARTRRPARFALPALGRRRGRPRVGRRRGPASSTREPPFDAAPWKGGFMRWADETLPEDEAERAITLRRACDIGDGAGHGPRRDPRREPSSRRSHGRRVPHDAAGRRRGRVPPRRLDPRLRACAGAPRRLESVGPNP